MGELERRIYDLEVTVMELRAERDALRDTVLAVWQRSPGLAQKVADWDRDWESHRRRAAGG